MSRRCEELWSCELFGTLAVFYTGLQRLKPEKGCKSNVENESIFGIGLVRALKHVGPNISPEGNLVPHSVARCVAEEQSDG